MKRERETRIIAQTRNASEVAETRVCPIVGEIVAEQDDNAGQTALAGAGFLTSTAPLVFMKMTDIPSMSRPVRRLTPETA